MVIHLKKLFQANIILRTNEHSVEIGAASTSTAIVEVTPPPLYSISSVDSNQLAANLPIEDKMTSARCLHTTGLLKLEQLLLLNSLINAFQIVKGHSYFYE